MQLFWNVALSLVIAYLYGSIPFGLIIVWFAKKKDLRTIESGRTGGTNAMRAAGLVAGLLTALMDVSKGVLAVWVASNLVPGSDWAKVAAALVAILGHNYSIFLAEKTSSGRWRLRGGAGGATAFGGAIGLWPTAALIILPLVLLVYLLVGYASVTTMSIALIATIIFVIRAIEGVSSWVMVGYGLAALIIVVMALRPNLERLRNGTERMVGLRAMWRKRRDDSAAES